MDDIVKQAMAKWPNVPHCYGWLALDARGNWRMRDERAQAGNLPGDKIMNAALLGFINRNYTHDGQGRWYFQNGPQRVYVNLDATPYIARTDPAQGFAVQTGEAFGPVEAAWITETGQLVLQSGEKVAMLDDRDMAQLLDSMQLDDRPVADEALLAWVADPHAAGRLTLNLGGGRVVVERIASDALAARFGFVPAPAA